MTPVLNYGLVALLFVAWIGLFAVKDSAREAAQQVADLNQQIESEQARIEDLQTDWAILNEPGYLQSLAQSQLGLEATASNQIVTMSALPPVPLDDTREPGSQGTFLASARGYYQYPSSAAPRTDPYADWAHPLLRPDSGR
jgi:cell division protein FtsL